jgi:hypothetical protein
MTDTRTTAELAGALDDLFRIERSIYEDPTSDIGEASAARKRGAVVSAAASRLRELEARNARLSKPDFYWDADNPETPCDDPFEYPDDYAPGEVREWSTGNQTGYVYAVMLPAEDDADTDDDWTFSSPDKAEVLRALADETELRAARRAHGGEG